MRIEMFMPGLGREALGALVHQDFATAVRAAGHQFRLVTTGAPGTDAMGDVLTTSGVWRAADHLAAPWLRTRTLLSPAAALARHLRRESAGIDLLHVEVAYPFGVSASLAADATGWRGPVAITPMGEDTLVHEPSHYGFRRYAAPRWLVARTLRAAAGLRCISPLHERAIAAIAPDTPRRVIPLNVSTAVIEAAREPAGRRVERRRHARAALDAERPTAARPVVLSLGRLHPFKGIDVLLSAMHALPDAVLLIAGPSLALKASGDEATRLSRIIDREALSDRVWLLGPVPPDVAMQLLAAADVLAVPSHLESLNKVCVEAAAVGTPFVVTATTGISHWARQADTGVVVPPGNPARLAEGLRTALRQPLPGADAIRAFTTPFSPVQVAANVCTFYEELLTRRR